MKANHLSYHKTHIRPNLSNSYPVLTALLTCLFIYAAASKLLAFGEFKVQLYRQSFPHSWSDILVYLLPSLEILAAVFLMIRRLQLAGLLISGLLLIAFSGYILLVLSGFWKHVPCSCGGILNHIGWGGHLALNLSFLLITLTALYINLKERRPANGKT